jgi:riboflavin biosynthesis pyrimidine reductase
MGLLRACADVVLVGAGTFRKAAGDRFDAAAIYPAAAPLFTEARARLGLAPQPRFVVVTGSGAIDTHGPALDGATIATTDAGAVALHGRAPNARVVSFGPGPLRVADVVARLRTEGARVVLTEGGPSLFAELVHDGAVDELFLTTAPRLFGRTPGDGRKGLTHGLDLGGRALELRSLRRHGAYLFSRYGLR